MCHLYFHTGDSINDTKPAVLPKPIKAAWLGCFVFPALVQQSKRKGGQHKKVSVRIITRKGKFVASVGRGKMLWGRNLHKLCSPGHRGMCRGISEAGCSSASGCTGRTHQSLSAPLSLQRHLQGLDLVPPKHSRSLANSTK